MSVKIDRRMAKTGYSEQFELCITSSPSVAKLDQQKNMISILGFEGRETQGVVLSSLTLTQDTNY